METVFVIAVAVLGYREYSPTKGVLAGVELLAALVIDLSLVSFRHTQLARSLSILFSA